LRPDGIRGVVLDLDDTLTDLATFELDMRGYRRARLEDALEPWTELPDAVFDDYFRIKQGLLDEVPPKPGAHETLRALRDAGLRLAILTNGPSDMQRGKLDRLGYLPLVDEVAISAEVAGALDAGLAAAYYVGPEDPPPQRERAYRLDSVADLPAALGLAR
jgi:FMN phosphatase YigB (HAD superfamily)